FDVAFTCNNHSLDYGGVAGLRRTVQVLRDNGLTVVGSRYSANEPRSSVVEANGVKVGVVAYTYETSSYGEWRSLNAAAMEDGAWDYLNGFRPNWAYEWSGTVCDADKEAIKSEINWCRENGAEVVVCYFHWDMNNEYVLEVTPLQSDLARFAAESGADVILGSHPHRVQRMEVLSLSYPDGTERQVPVYYSMGNYISNQRYETMDWTPADDPYASEQEIMAYLEISYNRTKGKVSFTKISALPLYVDKYWGSNVEYRIYPVTGDYESIAELQNSGNAWRATQARNTITGILGAQYIY
ncbi:MAG: CapA family protein, partial [Firmicutes bacterium]|nr:CapA family protein [Bacillota bacterium]